MRSNKSYFGKRSLLSSLSKLVLVSAITLGAGCTPNLETAVVNQLTDPPFPAKAKDDRIEMYEGTALGVEIWAFDETPKDPNFESCGGGSTCRHYDNAIDPGEVGIGSEGSISVHFVEDATYIIVAERAGEAVVLVSAQDTNGILEIPVTVLPQPDSGTP